MSKNEKNNLKFAAALSYAERGWPVLPLWWPTNEGCACEKSDCKENNRGKHPRPSNGLHAATTDLEKIKNWWEVTPDGNIGVRTGRDSFVVLDVDGPEGVKSLEKLENQYEPLPSTVTVITGGGLHFYFKHPEKEVKCSTGEIGEHLDIRGDGGYVIMPPSTHYSGRTYNFKEGHGIHEIEIADLPQWLLTLLVKPRVKTKKLDFQNSQPLSKINPSDIIKSGKRNQTLFKIACSLQGKGINLENILASLNEINQKRCQPPLDQSELQKIAKSVLKYPANFTGDDKISNSKIYVKKFFNPKVAVNLTEILKDNALLDSMAVLAEHDYRSYALIFPILKKKGLKSRDEAQLKQVIVAQKKDLRVQDSAIQPINSDGVEVSKFIDNPPVPVNYLIPHGYQIDIKTGIEKLFLSNKNSSEIIATAPILIQGRLRDISDGSEFITLIWFRDGTWKTHTVPRLMIADTQKIVTLADIGFPITSPTASQVVKFIHLTEAINIASLPVAELSKQLGWLGTKGDEGFLFGLRKIPADGTKPSPSNNIKNIISKPVKENSIVFYPEDPSEDSLAEGFNRKGTLNRWKKALDIATGNPVIPFMCYAAVSSILLEIFDLPNFIVDLSGPTTTGKTSALKFAASIFGNPNPSSNNSIIKTWNSTQVYVERIAYKLNGLPLFLDDTKLIRNPDIISKIIYQAAFGQGRGRGNLWSTAPVLTWNSVLLSTGESKILDLIKKMDGGAHGRVISVCTPPFPEQTSENSHLICELNQILTKNYGTAGIKFVRFILQKRDHWPQWKIELETIRKFYNEKSDKIMMYRQAEYFTAIHFAAQLFNEALGLSLDYKKHMDFIFNDVNSEMNRSSNMPLVALKILINHCIAHQSDFYTKDSRREQPHQGWLGVWNSKKGPSLIPTKLNQILEKHGYEPVSILKEWKRLGWLQTTKGRSLTLKRRVQVEVVRCYVIKRSAMDLVTKKRDK